MIKHTFISIYICVCMYVHMNNKQQYINTYTYIYIYIYKSYIYIYIYIYISVLLPAKLRDEQVPAHSRRFVDRCTVTHTAGVNRKTYKYKHKQYGPHTNNNTKNNDEHMIQETAGVNLTPGFTREVEAQRVQPALCRRSRQGC